MKDQQKTCTVEDCVKPPRNKRGGYCEMHYYRIRRHGSPDVVIPVSERQYVRGDTHPNWIGSQISYNGMHDRVVASRGSAADYPCVDCDSPAYHWSYDRCDADELVSPHGIPYSADVSHYVPRCVPCHKAFDLAAIAESREAS